METYYTTYEGDTWKKVADCHGITVGQLRVANKTYSDFYDNQLAGDIELVIPEPSEQDVIVDLGGNTVYVDQSQWSDWDVIQDDEIANDIVQYNPTGDFYVDVYSNQIPREQLVGEVLGEDSTPQDPINPEDISYAGEANPNTDLFKGIANEVNSILKKAYVLYLEAEKEYLQTFGEDPNSLAQYDWLQTNITDFGKVYEDGYTVNVNDTPTKIDVSHLMYKKYTFDLIRQLVDEGYDVNQLPPQLSDLYQHYGTAGSEMSHIIKYDYYLFLLSGIDYQEFEHVLQDAQASMLENELADSGFYDQVSEAATGYSEALVIDETYEQTLADARAILASWQKDEEQQLLRSLGIKINQMKHRPEILDISVTDIIGTFEAYHGWMQNRWNILNDMGATAQHIREQSITDEDRQRRIIIAYLLRFDPEGGYYNPHWDRMSLEALKQLAIKTIYANSPTVDYANTHLDFLGRDLGVADPFLQGLEGLAFVTFLVAGFIPGVGLFVDFADTIMALAAGDLVGAAINVLPFDEILSGARRLKRAAPKAIRAVFDNPASSAAIRLSKSEVGETTTKLGNKVDELDGRVRTARRKGAEAGVSLNKERAWYTDRFYGYKYTNKDTYIDINIETARQVLDEGIESGEIIYGYHNGQAYAFELHEHGYYYGYRIETNTIPKEALDQIFDNRLIDGPTYFPLVGERQYDPPGMRVKHKEGGHGSPMDLDDVTAQNVLYEGIQGDSKQVYGYYDGKVYEFQPDNTGTYHGYQIPGQEAGNSVLQEWLNKGEIDQKTFDKLKSQSKIQ